MGETSPDVVRLVEGVVRGSSATVVQQENSATGGVGSLAEILNQVDRTTERNVLDNLTGPTRSSPPRSAASCSCSRTSSSSTTARSR